MNCPIDGNALVMTERQGIEIDYCPQCRGVWLDRGELDKILERSAVATPQPPYQQPPPPPQSYQQPPPPQQQQGYTGGYQEGYQQDDYRGHSRKKKKEGFLGDLFDF